MLVVAVLISSTRLSPRVEPSRRTQEQTTSTVPLVIFERKAMAELLDITMASQEIEEKRTTPAFWTAFNAQVHEFRTTLKTLVPGNADDLNRLQALKTQLSELQVFATEATPLLAAYDVRRSQEEIETVGKELRDVETALKPKKKFAFTRNTTTSKPVVVATNTSTSSSSSKENAESKTTDDVTGSYVISSQTGTTLLLSPTELHAVSRDGVPVQLLIKDCSSVTVSAPTMLGSVRLEDLYDCVIFLGPCCTSVYLEDCRDCTVVLACHQLRIHKTHNCSLYVRVNTHPIIEDCTEMGFAQYSAVYDGIIADIEV